MTQNHAPLIYKPLQQAPDAEDLALHQHNSSTSLVTRRLKELVPLLDFTNFQVDEISTERTVLTIPLQVSSMNQNGTHQAAVFYLIADYALGIGMFGTLPGTYVTGVHDRCHALPIQYWLKQGSVRHIAPGTGIIRAEVSISKDKACRLRQQLARKSRAELTDVVRIYQGDTLVAEATHTMGVYVDMPRQAGIRANIFQVQNLKLSALMIAGLREDSLSQQVAGLQGRAIAHRMSLTTPQLPDLVRARTIHLEQCLREYPYEQVLVLAVGLDPKPVQWSSPQQKWFGIDLKEMLREREERFLQAEAQAANFIAIPADLRLDGWTTDILDAGFDSTKSTLVIMEGISMYLTKKDLGKTIDLIKSINKNKFSTIWMDAITENMFAIKTEAVQSFFCAINRLGESFISGYSSSELGSRQSTQSSEMTNQHEDQIHNEYVFHKILI